MELHAQASINSFNKYSCSVPGTVLDTGDTVVHKTGKLPNLKEFTFHWRKRNKEENK